MTCGCLEKLYHNVMLPNETCISLLYGLWSRAYSCNLFEQPYDEIMPENNTCFNLCKFCENARPMMYYINGPQSCQRNQLFGL